MKKNNIGTGLSLNDPRNQFSQTPKWKEAFLKGLNPDIPISATAFAIVVQAHVEQEETLRALGYDDPYKQ